MKYELVKLRGLDLARDLQFQCRKMHQNTFYNIHLSLEFMLSKINILIIYLMYSPVHRAQ